MKISIIGAGAMGSLFGGRLTMSDSRVLLYDINREHVNVINSEGLIIEEINSERREILHPKATCNPEDIVDSDIFIIFVKSTATKSVAEQFAVKASSNVMVVTLQNGAGNEEIIRKAFGVKRTAAGVTSQGATFLSPGHIRHAGKGPTYICMSDKKNDKLNPLIELLNQAGFETHIEKNIDNLVWGKLIINVGINALTALTGLPNGRLLDFQETKEIMADLVSEALAVAEAKGITLSYKNPLETVYQVAHKTAMNRSSMLQDFDNKKVSEINFINGAIIKEAEKYNLMVPVNRTITNLIRTMETLNLA